MKTNKDIIFPYYTGKIQLSQVIGHISLFDFIDRQKNPKLQTLVLIEAIKVAVSKEVKRELKQQLYAFTPSVYIKKNNNRRYDNIVYYTGLMQLDFDKIETVEKALDLKQYLFDNYPQIVCAYTSPSLNGVKCLLKITVPKDKSHYKALHKAVTLEFEQFGYFDEATKNAVLPLFLSIDTNILYRDYSECETWDIEDWSETQYVALNEIPRHQPTSSDYYYDKTVRIFKNKIEVINDNGHPQLRSACLILGSRAAAGYISLNEAEELAENCIDHNNYLQKDIANYKSTAKWAINNGFKNPKYY